MTKDEIMALANKTAGQHWGDEAHLQLFAAALIERLAMMLEQKARKSAVEKGGNGYRSFVEYANACHLIRKETPK